MIDQLDNTKDKSSSKPEVEHVEKQKQEYKLIGSFWRTKGLNLYSYSPFDGSLHKVDIKYSDTIHLEIIDNKLTPVDKEMQKATVDTRFVYFEALNDKSAVARVHRYRRDLNEMCNLKVFSDNCKIDIFNL